MKRTEITILLTLGLLFGFGLTANAEYNPYTDGDITAEQAIYWVSLNTNCDRLYDQFRSKYDAVVPQPYGSVIKGNIAKDYYEQGRECYEDFLENGLEEKSIKRLEARTKEVKEVKIEKQSNEVELKAEKPSKKEMKKKILNAILALKASGQPLSMEKLLPIMIMLQK